MISKERAWKIVNERDRAAREEKLAKLTDEDVRYILKLLLQAMHDEGPALAEQVEK